MTVELRRHHDMGGLPAGPVEGHDHDLQPWEKKVDAILRLLLAKKLITLDELRRGVEDLGPDVYDRLTYFERWIGSITSNLLVKGLIHVQELGEAIEEVERRHHAAGDGP